MLHSLVNRIKILRQDLIHREHMNLVTFEYRPERPITDDHALVALVLQIVVVHVTPYSFHRLRAGELGFVVEEGG